VKPTPNWDDLGTGLCKSFGILVDGWGEGAAQSAARSVDLVIGKPRQDRAPGVPKLPKIAEIGNQERA